MGFHLHIDQRHYESAQGTCVASARFGNLVGDPAEMMPLPATIDFRKDSLMDFDDGMPTIFTMNVTTAEYTLFTMAVDHIRRKIELMSVT